MRRAAAALAFAAAALSACGEDTGNFSQYPGFAAYFLANPPSISVPSPADRRLLEAFRPRIWLPAGNDGPIDFYRDYIASGRLLDGDGELIFGRVTPALLNRHKEDPGAVFEHAPTARRGHPVVHARIDRERLGADINGEPVKVAFTFLTYTVVFRQSGLPAGLAGWRAAGIGLIASLEDWHQLDHYTAVTLALGPRNRLIAATFQHHNYMRTHVFGVDLERPEDGRIAIDVAIRSNELYPHRTGRTVRRAVGLMNRAGAHYLITGRDRPVRAADDITEPASEIGYALVFLPPADAFYTFKGYLGQKRLLPGRSGPPGADYNTVPALKPKARQMIAFHWREDDADYLAAFGDGRPGRARHRGLARRFHDSWRCRIAALATGCALLTR